MNMAEVMPTSAAALDETFEEMTDNAESLCRYHGGTATSRAISTATATSSSS
jgi:hypothetical protein